MRQLFLDIKAKIEADLPEIKFIAMYNGQFEDIEQQGQGASIYSFPSPFALIEFPDGEDLWKQLGDGVQIADPFIPILHIGHNQFDAQDGTQEQNLDIYDLAKKFFQKFNKFEPDGCVQWIRIGMIQDKHHTNIYHFAQPYRTNYVDTSAQESANGTQKAPPTNLETSGSYDTPPYTKTIPG